MNEIKLSLKAAAMLLFFYWSKKYRAMALFGVFKEYIVHGLGRL